MSELSDFLLERIAEDEELARNAAGAPWVALQWPGGGQVLVDPVAIRDNKLRFGDLGHVASTKQGDAEHIARHSPARVLAEAEAKRRIVERYAHLAEHGDSGDARWLLPLLALPYADHPDYDQEWRP